jgi:hypothetical protein
MDEVFHHFKFLALGFSKTGSISPVNTDLQGSVNFYSETALMSLCPLLNSDLRLLLELQYPCYAWQAI